MFFHFLKFQCRKTWGYGGYDKELSEATAEAAFKKSLECGVKLIDTASMYGEGNYYSPWFHNTIN